jgi:hypothetical protein
MFSDTPLLEETFVDSWDQLNKTMQTNSAEDGLTLELFIHLPETTTPWLQDHKELKLFLKNQQLILSLMSKELF